MLNIHNYPSRQDLAVFIAKIERKMSSVIEEVELGTRRKFAGRNQRDWAERFGQTRVRVILRRESGFLDPSGSGQCGDGRKRLVVCHPQFQIPITSSVLRG